MTYRPADSSENLLISEQMLSLAWYFVAKSEGRTISLNLEELDAFLLEESSKHSVLEIKFSEDKLNYVASIVEADPSIKYPYLHWINTEALVPHG